jgi:hypothetical protein
VLVLMVLASPLVACSVPVPSSGDLTLDQAKSEVREAEDDILALVPADVVTATLPRPETSAVLFECTAPGTYYWPGGAQLRIDASADSGAIIGEIHDAWAGRTDWDVTWKKRGEDGVYHLDLLREDGLHLAVANLESNTILNVSSFSPCFALDDYDPNSSY